MDPSQNKSYQPLSKNDHDDDDSLQHRSVVSNEHEDGEDDSLVIVEDSIFRRSSKHPYQEVGTRDNGMILTPTSPTASLSHSTIAQEEDCDDEDSELSMPLSRSSSMDQKSPSRHLARASSNDLSNQGNSFDAYSDDDDWEDDTFTKRYHLDIRTPPLPSEFRNHDISWTQRVYHNFQDLRKAARQRQAARLLNMPSESWRHRAIACLISHGLDASDAGMLIVAILTAMWLLIGAIGVKGTRTKTYWIAGSLVFILRVSARRLYEGLAGKFCYRGLGSSSRSTSRGMHMRLRQRQRLNTGDAVEFQHDWSAKETSNITEGTASESPEVV